MVAFSQQWMAVLTALSEQSVEEHAKATATRAGKATSVATIMRNVDLIYTTNHSVEMMAQLMERMKKVEEEKLQLEKKINELRKQGFS